MAIQKSPSFKDYRAFFKAATKSETAPDGFDPFPYQERLSGGELPQILNIPTGAGKTAAVILAWLWRRRFADEETRKATPRRLVYCLPMRVLVEQTRDEAKRWLKNKDIDFLAEKPGEGEDKIAVTVLMGGEDTDKWDYYPERDAIIIGTQDMLLSRALNRGYAMSRYRWPVHYALLNNDCLWVMDEVQLMGVGVETSAQMQAFREKLGCYGNPTTIWMSATVGENQLATVDHPVPKNGFLHHALEEDDLSLDTIGKRLKAKKAISKAGFCLDSEDVDYAENVAGLLIEKHKKGTLTLCIVNQVKRAQNVFRSLKSNQKQNPAYSIARIALIHSRFRQKERDAWTKVLEEEGDRIVVATQAVEAGVDVSAQTLVTEIAPWPSLVQRFGRCNRYGESGNAEIIWIDLNLESDGDEDTTALPYSMAELEKSKVLLDGIADGGVETVRRKMAEYVPEEVTRQVIRRKDAVDLFDTTADLTGSDLDVSRFVRDGVDTDVQFYWRELVEEFPPKENVYPSRGELCPVSIGDANEFAKKYAGFVWNPLEARWMKVGKGGEADRFFPGQAVCVQASEGGYSEELGWDGSYAAKKPVPVSVLAPSGLREEERDGADEQSFDGDGKWVTLSSHCADVLREIGLIESSLVLPKDQGAALETAARWHDVGKAHAAFQNVVNEGAPQGAPGEVWAKSGQKNNGHGYYVIAENGIRVARPHFRHELASALAWLCAHPAEHPYSDLIAYIIAAHHGKVRLSIRSIPQESKPHEDTLFARGVWQGDALGPVRGLLEKPISLDLSVMQLGEGSWLERMLSLRDDKNMGVFRLAYLEALLRIADWRASRREDGGVG
ncbi:MAG: CRISPR-associated helicase Cas3' [Candidatus ainarchaeum sp.]|nr:CRISPR-associated helicase Cas3' [Candidatus ainarchaeum sp.]